MKLYLVERLTKSRKPRAPREFAPMVAADYGYFYTNAKAARAASRCFSKAMGERYRVVEAEVEG